MTDISGAEAFDNVLDRLLASAERSQVYHRERDELRQQRDEFRRECDRLRASLTEASAEIGRLRTCLTTEAALAQPMGPRPTPIATAEPIPF